MCLQRVRFASYLCFTPGRLRKICPFANEHIRRCKHFPISIRRNAPFRAIRFVNRGGAGHSTGDRPYVLLLEASITFFRRLLRLNGIFLNSLRVLLRRFLCDDVRPLMYFVGLMSFQGTRQGCLH